MSSRVSHSRCRKSNSMTQKRCFSGDRAICRLMRHHRPKDGKPMRFKQILLASALFATVGTAAAHANEPFSLVLSWRAQAENGGYYEAQAKGYYAACGLDM